MPSFFSKRQNTKISYAHYNKEIFLKLRLFEKTKISLAITALKSIECNLQMQHIIDRYE